MKQKRLYRISEAAEIVRTEEEAIARFIKNDWIKPMLGNDPWLDDDDVSRACLIHELQQDYRINDEGITIILQLVDEVCRLQLSAKKEPKADESSRKREAEEIE